MEPLLHQVKLVRPTDSIRYIYINTSIRPVDPANPID